jgi:hypothetical protein
VTVGIAVDVFKGVGELAFVVTVGNIVAVWVCSTRVDAVDDKGEIGLQPTSRIIKAKVICGLNRLYMAFYLSGKILWVLFGIFICCYRD